MINPVDSVGMVVFGSGHKNAKELGRPTIPKTDTDDVSEKNAVVYPGQHADQEPPPKTQQVSDTANLEDVLKQEQNGKDSKGNMAEHQAKLKDANNKHTDARESSGTLAKLKDANNKHTDARESSGTLAKMKVHMDKTRKSNEEKALAERKKARGEVFYAEDPKRQRVSTVANMEQHLKHLKEKSEHSNAEKADEVERAQKQKVAAAAEQYKAIEAANKDASVEYPEQSISMMLA